MAQFMIVKVYVEWAAAALLLIIALRKGAVPERICTAVFAGLFVVDKIYHLIVGGNYVVHSVNIGHFIIDLVAAGICVWVALNANRVYTLCFASFQMAALMSHPVRALFHGTQGGAYAILGAGPSYLQVVALAIGLYNHIQRTKRYGPYPSWHDSSSRSLADAR